MQKEKKNKTNKNQQNKNKTKAPIDKRNKILDLNKIKNECNVFPELIQDDVKSRGIYLFFIVGFYLSFREFQVLVEYLFQFQRENKLKTTETEDELTNLQENQKKINLAILLFGIKLIFYLILMFLSGYSNSSPHPRIKTAILSLMFSLGMMFTLAFTSFVTNFITGFELGMICLFCLYNLLYVITSCRKKGRIIANFTNLKNEVYFEYTFQKLFKKPSIYWRKKQKKNFIKKLNKKGNIFSKLEIEEKFVKFLEQQHTQNFFNMSFFKKVINIFKSNN
jgi:hypothetical protein